MAPTLLGVTDLTLSFAAAPTVDFKASRVDPVVAHDASSSLDRSPRPERYGRCRRTVSFRAQPGHFEGYYGAAR
jgi:hypothetical protein